MPGKVDVERAGDMQNAARQPGPGVLGFLQIGRRRFDFDLFGNAMYGEIADKRQLHGLVGDFDLGKPNRLVAAIADRHEIPCLDLQPDLERARVDGDVYFRQPLDPGRSRRGGVVSGAVPAIAPRARPHAELGLVPADRRDAGALALLGLAVAVFYHEALLLRGAFFVRM